MLARIIGYVVSNLTEIIFGIVTMIAVIAACFFRINEKRMEEEAIRNKLMLIHERNKSELKPKVEDKIPGVSDVQLNEIVESIYKAVDGDRSNFDSG